jgi:hypothetical protein
MSSAKLIVVAAFSLEKKLDDVAEDGVVVGMLADRKRAAFRLQRRV